MCCSWWGWACCSFHQAPAGAQYAKAGMIDAALLKEIDTPMIPEEQYAAIVNGGV